MRHIVRTAGLISVDVRLRPDRRRLWYTGTALVILAIGLSLALTARAASPSFLVRDIDPGEGSSLPSGLANVGGTLYFAANDGSYGTELWKSDGTAAHTRLVGDVNPGPASSQPTNLTNVNGKLFFVADDG